MRYLAALALLLLPLQARADVTWNFAYTSVSADDPTLVAELPLSVTVTDQAFRNGGLHLSWGMCSGGQVPCSHPAQGDFSQLVALQPINPLDQISPFAAGYGVIDLHFGADGGLGAYIDQLGENTQVFLVGGTGRLGAYGCIPCYITGYWQLASPLPAPVPEPTTMACLLTGLAGIGIGRRRSILRHLGRGTLAR
jgi:hypothetical protein